MRPGLAAVAALALCAALCFGTAAGQVVNQPTDTYCWGWNDFGQLGNGQVGETTKTAAPTLVAGGEDLQTVSAGGEVTCGLRASNSTAVCWGLRGSSLIGIDGSTRPLSVPGSRTYSTVEAGSYHACGISDGRVWCWGEGKSGKLGQGTTANTVEPVPLFDSSKTFTALALGREHTCALEAPAGGVPGGAAWCWGGTWWGWEPWMAGPLGAGYTSASLVPLKAEGAQTYSAITAGSSHTCAIEAAPVRGRAWCWGVGPSGELGSSNSSLISSGPPTEVAGGHNFTVITASNTISKDGEHTCGLDTEGVAWCWGRGDKGQVGDGGTTQAAQPARVAGGHIFVSLDAGGRHVCGVDVEGAAWCWGANFDGEGGSGPEPLGTFWGPGQFVAEPSEVAGNLDFLALSAGSSHTCGLVPRGSTPDFSIPPRRPRSGADAPAPAPAAAEATASSEGGSSSNTAAIVGGVVGGVCAVAAGVAAWVFVRRRRQKKEEAAAGGATDGSGASPPFKGSDKSDVEQAQGGMIAAGNRSYPPGSGSGQSVGGTVVPASVPPSANDDAFSLESLRAFQRLQRSQRTERSSAWRSGEPDSTGSAAEGWPSEGYASAGTDDQAWLARADRAAAARAMGRPAGGGGGMDVKPWEIYFEELNLVEVIGEGSFGRVFLARWHEVDVAVKVLIAGGISDIAARLTLSHPLLASLQAEASTMASLQHPCCVQFLGVIAEPPAIVTEYCSRGSLADVLWQARGQGGAAAAALTWHRRLSIAVEAAAGLVHLHGRAPPVVHRDLKSPNILIDRDWHAKVADFNLAKVFEETQPDVASSAVATNPRWLSPEVLRGEHATFASDVYAMGICLWEILTWELPWRGVSNPFQIGKDVRGGVRPPLPADPSRLPGGTFPGMQGYLDLMQSCWAQRPQDRPAFGEVVERLRDLRALAADS